MDSSYRGIEEVLIAYLSGGLLDEKRLVVDTWRKGPAENEKASHEVRCGWGALPILKEMGQFNSVEASREVRPCLEAEGRDKWSFFLQRIVAVLFVPLVACTAYMRIKNFPLKRIADIKPITQTLTSRHGAASRLAPDDGRLFWAGSGSTLQLPLQFSGEKSEKHT